MHTFGPGCGEATARGNNSGLSERPRPGREEEREEPAAQYFQRPAPSLHGAAGGPERSESPLSVCLFVCAQPLGGVNTDAH